MVVVFAIATAALPTNSAATDFSREPLTEMPSRSVVAAPCSDVGIQPSQTEGPADPAQGPSAPVDIECLLIIEVLEPMPGGPDCIIWELWCEIDGVLYWWGQNLLCEED